PCQKTVETTLPLVKKKARKAPIRSPVPNPPPSANRRMAVSGKVWFGGKKSAPAKGAVLSYGV
ncbi:MAG: hypothetical protein AAB799_00505, partial [Patescibacteria group bacterium]